MAAFAFLYIAWTVAAKFTGVIERHCISPMVTNNIIDTIIQKFYPSTLGQLNGFLI